MIVGIDTGSRRLAVCALLDDEAWFDWHEAPATKADEELQDLKWWLENTKANLVRACRTVPDVWAESLADGRGPNSNPQSLMRQSFTVGMVLATVGGTLISPSTWKANILGHGHADKSDIRRWVESTAPEVAAAVQAASPTRADRRQDLYDAYCIALHGDLARRHPLQLDEGRRVPRRRVRAG